MYSLPTLDFGVTNIIYGIRLKHDPTYEYRYVGLTSGGLLRLKEHIVTSKRLTDDEYASPKYRWLRKHYHNVVFDVLEAVSSREELPLYEMKWVHILKTRGHRLLNVTDGGEGTFGWSPNDEWRIKRSSYVSGEKNPMYGKSGVLSPNYGKHRDSEFCVKLSLMYSGEGNPFYGKKHTDENMKIFIEKSSGENNKSAKLTETDVLYIREMQGCKDSLELGAQFGINRNTVYRIWNRQSWKLFDLCVRVR